MLGKLAIVMVGWAFAIGAAAAAEDHTRFLSVSDSGEVVPAAEAELNSLAEIVAWTCEQDGQGSGVVAGDGNAVVGWSICLPFGSWETPYYE